MRSNKQRRVMTLPRQAVSPSAFSEFAETAGETALPASRLTFAGKHARFARNQSQYARRQNRYARNQDCFRESVGFATGSRFGYGVC